jgi:hypothetical protein
VVLATPVAKVRGLWFQASLSSPCDILSDIKKRKKERKRKKLKVKELGAWLKRYNICQASVRL